VIATTDAHPGQRCWSFTGEACSLPTMGKATGSVQGSRTQGVSATTNHQGSDLLYVFSTSTVFEAGKAYSKFAAYAIPEHGSDFSAAARPGCARRDKRRHGWWLRRFSVKAPLGIRSINSYPLAFYPSLLAMPITIWLTFLSW
jgi:hypothetical protein